MDELASLDQSARENAPERFRIIQPCLEQDRSSKRNRQRGRNPISNRTPMDKSLPPMFLEPRAPSIA